MSKTTCHRPPNTLMSLHYIIRAPHGVGYQPGGKVIELGQNYLAQVDACRIPRPYIVELERKSEDTAFFSFLTRMRRCVVDRVDEPNVVHVFILHLGGRQPLHVGAAPLALLADKTDNEIADLVRRRGLKEYTPYTIPDLEHLLVQLGTSESKDMR